MLSIPNPSNRRMFYSDFSRKIDIIIGIIAATR
jgi:hypothetical protein